MPTAFSTIKSILTTVYGTHVGAGNLVESDSGSPSELAMFLDFVHNRIVGTPVRLPCCFVNVSITSTGASSYNLKTLYPDLLSVFQVYNVDQNASHHHFGPAEGNITPIGGWMVKNGVLYFTGAAPAAGSTFGLEYKSQFLVENSAGVRKRYFEDATDVSALPFAHENVLIFGFGEFVNWKADESSQEKRRKTETMYQEAWQNLMLHADTNLPIESFL